MSDEIIGLHHWFESAPGRYLLEWEQARLDDAVADVFGYHALQLGMPWLQGLRANRMPHRWLALGMEYQTQPVQQPALWADPVALPFPANSLDLVLLPHALEHSPDPHAALREVARVLVPEGRVVVCGINPASLWGLRQRRARLCQRLGWGQLYLPDAGEFIGYWRLRDWLRLLDFEVESASFGCWRPAVRSSQWLERFRWFDAWGRRWWPILGAAYFVVAVKRVHGMRLLEPAWRGQRQRAGASVPLVSRAPGPWAGHHLHKD
ncbi:MAG: methyltransferase type 11 [Comamonadaceae bacterium SCN 68-20]|nr:MAG: methyltransferase type 11 [Comamonadaceae bacterium SCN 68-20]OJX18698.1 MAG: methyltransferase type 11 [Burkholderiales bacterium 68-20]